MLPDKPDIVESEMADYYPLIARAIAGLDPSAPGESRRALYERARTALIAQLRSVQPPLSESEITRERLSLEEAVRKVESEAAQRAREATPRRRRARRAAGDAFRAAPTPRPRPAEVGAAAAVRSRAAAGRAAVRRARVRRRRRPRATSVRRSARKNRPPRNLRADAPPPGAPRPQPPQVPMQEPAAAADPRTVGRAAPRPRERPAAAARRACAASATSPPTPTISAAPRRRPTAPRERPMPTCRRPRRSSTGSSRAWKTAAPIPTRPIRMTNRSRRPSATRRRQPAARALAASRTRPRAEEARPHRRGVSVQERDRGRRRADPGRRRDPVGQVAGDDRQRPVQVLRHGGGSAEGCRRTAVAAEDPRSRRPAVVEREQVAPVAQRVVLYDEDPVRSQGQAICRLGDLAHRTDQGERPTRSPTSPCAPTSRFPTASSR